MHFERDMASARSVLYQVHLHSDRSIDIYATDTYLNFLLLHIVLLFSREQPLIRVLRTIKIRNLVTVITDRFDIR